MKVNRTGKAFLAILVILSLMLPGMVSAAGESYNGIQMMPAAELAAELGGTFEYNHSALSGVIKSGANELSFRLDNAVAKFNGKFLQAPAPMKIISNRFMLPADFAREVFGLKSITHKVVWGDNLWKISVTYGTTIAAIKQLNGLTSDIIYPGQVLVVKNSVSQSITVEASTTGSATLRSGPGFEYSPQAYLPAYSPMTVTGKAGDWYKVNTVKGSGYMYYTVLSVKQDMADTAPNSTYFSQKLPVDTSRNFITYKEYKVVKGDTLWSIADANGVTLNGLAAANGLSNSAYLSIGQIIKIPVYNIPVKEKQIGYGELLDWFSEGQYVFPVNATGKLTDLRTGKSFMVQRTTGASHSDTETLSLSDTVAMKEIFGGFTWERRPFLLETGGRVYAVSVSGMPHAGLDAAPYLQNVSNRSDNWGYGPNYDKIKGNGMDGHFDLYFLNGIRHVDNKLDPQHQYSVLSAAGLR